MGGLRAARVAGNVPMYREGSCFGPGYNFRDSICTEMQGAVEIPRRHNARSAFSVCSRGNTLDVVDGLFPGDGVQPECPPRAVNAEGWAR